MAGFSKGGVCSIAEDPTVFITVFGGILDIDGEGFAAFEGIDTGVEAWYGLFVDGDNNGVTTAAGCAFVSVDGLDDIGSSLVSATDGFNVFGGVASWFPEEGGDTWCGVLV